MTVQVPALKEEEPVWEYWQAVREDELMRKRVEKARTG